MNTKIIFGIALMAWISTTATVSAFAQENIMDQYTQDIEQQLAEANSNFFSGLMNDYIQNIKEQLAVK